MFNSNEQEWLSILGDPGASESEWTHAASRLEVETRRRPPHWYRLMWQLPLITTILLSFFGSCAVCVFVQLGFDWGYRVVQQICGQPGPQALNQGVVALNVLPHVVFPLNLGLAFACFRRYFTKKRPWLLALFGTLAIELTIWYGQSGDGTNWKHPESWLWMLFAGVVAALAYSVGYKILRRFYLYWDVRLGGFINIRRTMPDCAIYLIPSLILGILAVLDKTPDVPLPLEIIAYALPLFIIGARTVAASRSLVLALVVSSMILAPVVVTNILNVSGTVIAALMDCAHIGPELSWRAALSASLIMFVTLGATASGCLWKCTMDDYDRK